MTQHFLIRSTPHDPVKLEQSFVLACQNAISTSKLVTFLLPMVNQVSSFGLEKVIGDGGVKSLKSKRTFTSNGITFHLKSDKTIKSNEENGVVLALSCPVSSLNKLSGFWKTDVIIAMSFGLDELDEWALNVKAVCM